MADFIRKWGLALKVLIITAIVVGIKFFFHAFDFEPIANNPLLGTVIGGMTFLIGFILSGTLVDYKESEKYPSEIVASLEAIAEEGRYFKKLNKEFNLDKLQNLLDRIAEDILDDIRLKRKKKAISTVSELSESIFEAEKLGISVAWVGRLKAEQASLKKMVLRIYHIKSTSFVPAAYAIVDIMVLITIVIMLLLNLEPLRDAIIMISIITFLFLYMTMLIKDIDDPFEIREGSYADIDLFLFKAFKNREKR